MEKAGSYSFRDVVTSEHWKTIREVDRTNVFVYRGQIIELRKGPLALVSWLHIGLLVTLAILDWRWTLLLYAGAFVLAVLPVLESVGSLIAKPFYRVLQSGIDY